MIKLGKDPQTAAQFPDEDWHLGDSAYMGQLDVIHQIHCLNQLRFRAFADYYPSNKTAEERKRPEWSWVHLQHCVSILLENLMCQANTEILTLNWIEEADYPFPDFSVGILTPCCNGKKREPLIRKIFKELPSRSTKAVSLKENRSGGAYLTGTGELCSRNTTDMIELSRCNIVRAL